jgi:GT2 family glycosyltransferase
MARMTDLSVITIVRNRPRHLARLIEGLANSATPPSELIVVDMSDEPVCVPRFAFPHYRLGLQKDHLALAAARNAGAESAQCSRLLFLDVDCIPRQNLITVMIEALIAQDGLICPEVRYLGPESTHLHGDSALERSSVTHPVRVFPNQGYRIEPNAGLFWSLAFGIRRRTFEDLKGFDEGYEGYGGEDTDFGFRAEGAGVPLIFLGGTGAFHQHHGVISPPLHHLHDIVRNANRFFQRWGVWPMEGWLRQFQDLGVVAFDEQSLRVIRPPTPSEFEAARQPASVYF